MDTDERLRWMEVRISTSLRPRADDLKSLFLRDESRATVLEFFSNDEAHHLFIFTLAEDKGGIRVSLSSPRKIAEKCLCFVKTGTASQLHAGNFDDGVTCLDWSEVLPHADLFVRDVFLPLLCTDTELMLEAAGEGLVITPDKLMDILHRLLGNLEVSRGVVDGAVTLPLPCIEVLAEAAAFQQRQSAVIHVLESAVVGWIRQIRNVLRHDSLNATRQISKEANEPIRPHHELEMWEQHIQHATSILQQLDAPMAMDILMNLNQAGSAYAKSFGDVREEIEQALDAAKARLRCFATVLPWIQDMYRTSSLERMLKVFPPLLHTVLLIWKHSDYYHDPKPFAQLLKMLSNEVVARARSLVGDNPFEDTQHSYVALKDALRLCAAFRGTYLDFKERANAFDTEKIESTVITMARLRPKNNNVLFRAKMYGPTGYQQWLSRSDQQREEEDNQPHWVSSPWPPRNERCFNGLSRFVERCNDLLDLVETTKHFLTLEEAARIGGAGSRALDALIADIHQVFVRTIKDFTSRNHDVLTIDEKQHFEKAFFNYRSVIKTLEHRLASVLRTAIRICPNAMSHLRVLEVFEGISARELLQKELQTENHSLIIELTKEFRAVKSMFETSLPNIPRHLNMPPTVSKLVWVRAMKQRIGVPMAKVRQVCQHALESDLGWQLRDAYTETMNEIEKYETRLITMWSRSVATDLRDRLKQPVLAVEQINTSREQSQLWDADLSETGLNLDPEDKGQKVTGLKVNLDATLLEMLRDVHYLQCPPHDVSIPASVRSLLRSVDSSVLQTRSSRLRTIVSKYNHVMQWMQDHEQLLFENKMRKVGELIAEGTENVTWGSADLDDFLEKCSSLICDDVHNILTRVHNNWDRVKEMSRSWSEGALDIFTSHQIDKTTKSLSELLEKQTELDELYKYKLIPSGVEIHALLNDSFKVVELSAASPAWQLYTAEMDAMVLMALKSSILTSLDAMYTIITENLMESEEEPVSILEVRLELVEQTVSFSPPLDRSSSVDNVEDGVSQWLSSFVKRSTLIKRLTDTDSSYSEFLSDDQDVWEVVNEIQHAAQENTAKCKQLLSIFDNYKFLWVQDVQQSFTDFLNGRPSPNPLRVTKQAQTRTSDASRNRLSTQRSRYSVRSPDAINEAERAFLTSKHGLRSQSRGTEPDTTVVVPGLSEFDDEIGIYRTARDNIIALPDRKPVGWLMFDFQPIKQVLTTYASKWMWTFIKYLCDQVTDSLDTLADFLARTEPEIESITGEERDTASFMKMMRLFNEVSAQQQDMDGRFSVMQRTVDLLEKYDMKLPNETQEMFKSAPDRWNHLKTKVSLAKQRLGPRIQEESDRITRDLLRFSDRVESLATELRTSDVFSRECPIGTANHTIDTFARRLKLLQAEAQDLIELQELLDTAVVNFSVLPQYQRDLRNLKIVWDHVWMVEAEQRDWKMKHWQKIDTKHLQQAVQKQKDLIQSLPPEVSDWDVYLGMIASVTVIEQCLPLVEDLNHPAMRTRHWKQLVRITGGLLQTDTDSLRKMVVGDLLELGLQKHGDEVKSIVQRAVKDLTIESSLKTCEEVWLSKVFEIRPHTRGQSKAVAPDLEAGSEMTGSEMMPHALLQTYEGSRTGGTRTKSMKSGVHSRSSDKTGGSVSRGKGGGRASVLSLPVSLLNLVDDPSPICLLRNVEKIFSELEHHQVELNRMQSNSAIGSFLDEVTKWQKRLHLIEAVLEAWVNVQTKWVQLDDVYSGADVRTALAHEANMFAVMSKDFRLLMRATEKNTNVLQSCSRKGILPMLEKMDIKMESCRHALLGNLERRRQRFPRFYFLSPEDVMNIVCYGYDLDAVNKYLCKILPHLGRLVFEEVVKSNNLTPPRHTSAALKKKYKVTGVSSAAGEVMTFHRPLVYEGPMSLWLPQLLMAIQATLQENLHIALGNEARPAQIVQTLRSAGASRVRISRPSSAISQRSGSDNIPKVAVTAANQHSDTESLASGKALPVLEEKPSSMATQLSQTLGTSIEPEQVSWTLDNPTQVVLLATTVKMNQSIYSAIEETSKGDDMALIKVADSINNQLGEAVIMLKGMEDERAVRLRSAKKKGASRGREHNEEGGREESDASESIRAPSTRSMLDDDMEGTDEAFIDDAMAGGDAGGPINTMQSLLFTDQVRSGSRGTRGDVLDGDFNDQNNQEGAESSAQPDGKLLLFPSQIQKISGLIGLMTQQRDVCHHLQRLMSMESSGRMKPDEIFDWQMRLHHLYNPETMDVKVQVNDSSFDYGFEYQGSALRYVVSPSCDRVLLSMCQALHTNIGVALTNTSTLSGPPESLAELSYQLGRALYNVVCTHSVDHYMLGDLFKGLAETGCWMCLSRFDSLSAPVLSVAGQLAAEVQKALCGGKPSITLMSEEVTLSPTAACFITLDGDRAADSSPSGCRSNLNQLSPTMSKLPVDCISCFRIVNAIPPDRRLVLEIQLLSQGFTEANTISRKLCVFLDLCGSLLSTLPICSDASSFQACNSSNDSAKHGIQSHDNNYASLSLMEHVIAGAGVVLDILFREQIELKQEYRELIASKTRKFTDIWKHRSSLMSSSGGLVPSSNAADDNLGGPLGVSASSLAPSIDPTTQEAIQTNKDRELVESDAEVMRKMEEIAVVTALRNILAPRLPLKEDRSLVSTFVMDLWPDADVEFGVEEEEERKTDVTRGEFTSPPEDWDEEMNADVTIPDHQVDSETRPFEVKVPQHEPVNDVEAAVAIATKECGLSPAVKFQAKAAQLTELSESIKSVIVCGPAGCGKSKCIEVYTKTQKQLGFNVISKKVYINAIDSRRKLFGYFENHTREWKDGLMQIILRPHCLGQDSPTSTELSLRPSVFILHVDGQMRSEDTELFLQLLRTQPGGRSWLSLPNNERLRLPPDIRVIWEMENLSSLAPGVVSKLGVLGFNCSEVTWKLHLNHWLGNLPDSISNITKEIVMRYLPTLVNHFTNFTAPPHLVDNGSIQLQQTIRISTTAMTSTFCKLMDCLLPHNEMVSPNERERYIGYSAFWAFGGTLDGASRDLFGMWWNETWPSFFPFNGSDVWRQFVDSETRSFSRWEDHLPQFSGSSIVSGAFVPTPDTCQLTHLVGALMDAGHATMIVGPPGCGKSAVVRERINNVSSGEVAEVLSLFLHCNRITEASTLWKQVSQLLEWKHGVTYTPRGNKKLLCMVDDLNLCRPLGTENEHVGLQSACELIRQHLDVGGVRNPTSHKWQQVSSTSYITTCNPRHTGTSCGLHQRMTRHFSVFSCVYPSVASQHAIYSTLVQNHFMLENKTTNSDKDQQFQKVLSDITLVTVELQERLRSMYLNTPERAHYTFSLNDLERIFRNIMLSLATGCHQRDLLLLWRHECDWSYGKRMISDVDCERYLQALDTAVRKHLTENKYLPLVLSSKQPLFSSVRELDSGLVTAGRHFGRNSSSSSGQGTPGTHVTDYYKPAQSEKEVHHLLMEAVKEYNKINVQMKLTLYSDTIALVCRLARVLQSPHPISHSLLFGDGCPVLAPLIVNLAAHLGGFRVSTLPPIISPTGESHTPAGGPATLMELDRTRLTHMKKHLIQLYNQAGVKGDKIVFLIHDDKEVTNECLTMVEELVRHGSISHLFTTDEQTTIANSVRSEVTAAGLTYSRDVAWNFFLNTVTKNLRVVLICSQTGQSFMEKSLEFPALFSRMSCAALHHWSHDQLISNAMYHVANSNHDSASHLVGEEGNHVMSERQKENIVHLLANMHMSVKEKDSNKFYKILGHVCNYSFEKLVERFVCIFRDRHRMVQENHSAIKGALENIDRENSIAEALQKDLDREKQVLEEHKSGTLKLLAQIGQDMVITEQQVSAVRKQIRKIRHLKKSLPEYELAHEKAVFKAAAIVADTKTVVKEIDVQDLSELRSLQKPDADVEDLMAAIIMILKSPNSDVTWSKGAKRQMANLDRFLDELVNFDEVPMPQGTLENLESFWEKETFTPENLTVKAGGNTAAGSLLKWVQGVVRYHTTMMNRVKPLHAKVEETASSIGDAQHKLRQLESKKGALEARLHDLAEGFEQATADKNTQEEKRMEMQDHLRVAVEFRQVLTEEHKRCCAALSSYKDRIEWVTGAAAIAAGFATYLAPYPFMFRRMMLTVDWAQCLVEKGIPLVFDSTDPITGHNIEFMLDVNDSGLDSQQTTAREGNMDEQVESGEGEMESEEPSINFNQSASNDDTAESEKQNLSQSNLAINGLPPVAEESDGEDHEDVDVGGSTEIIPEQEVQEQAEEEVGSRMSLSLAHRVYTMATLPYISAEEYHSYVNSVIKVLVGEETLQDWFTKDFAHHQLQNAAVMLSSWQRPPLLLDPYLAGADWCAVHLRRNPNITPVNLTPKIENTHVMAIEKSVLGGHTLMLMDCENQAGALVRPLIHHSNTAGWRKERSSDESQTLRFLGRRLLCPDSFLLYLTTTHMSTNRLHPDITASTQLISYVPSTETLQEDLLLRAVSRVRPDIYRERHHVAIAIRQHRHTLKQLDAILCERLVTGDDPRAIENSTKFLSSVVHLKQEISEKLESAKELQMTLTNLIEELYPIAQRGAFLYSMCRAIPALNPHYQVPLPYFTHLFDSAVGSEYDEGDEEVKPLQEVTVVHPGDVEDEDEEERMKMAARRKASLRLGSARKTIKMKSKMKGTLGTTAEEDIENSESPDASPEETVDDAETSERPGSGSHVVVPQVDNLPTPGVEYSSFSLEKVQEIVETLTKRIFASVYGSVCPEHRLPVTALALLNIQLDGADAKFTEEEMTLLIHGNPGFGRSLSIGLSDFDCTAAVPDWLPADRWEDLLAFSVLPGTLEGVCVRVAENSEQWKEWFQQVAPETVPFPDNSGPPNEESNQELSDFQRLLLIRTLRGDRIEPALRLYVNQNIKDSTIHEVVSADVPLDLETLFKDVSNTLGILVLLPDSNDVTMETRVAIKPEDAIKQLAQKYKVNVESVLMGDGYVQEAGRCIDTALSQDTWALINCLHLAPNKFFEDLQIQLARVGNISRQSEGNNASMALQGSHFQVWMTTRPHESIPSLLTQYLYKLSWDTLLKLAVQDPNNPGSTTIMTSQHTSVIKSCLISIIARIRQEIMSKWCEANKKTRRIVYSICFCHAVMVARQCFGWHGNNKSHPLLESVLHQAISHALAEEDEVKGIKLAKGLYDDVITTSHDRRYMHQLFEDIVNQVTARKGDKVIDLNGIQFPSPSSDVAPADYAAWLNANLPDDDSLIVALSLPSTATTWQVTQRGEKLLTHLQDLFNVIQQPGYESNILSHSTGHGRAATLTLQGLQSVIDLCSEKLPPLLNLGRSDKERLTEFNFPYHRASVLSSGNPEIIHMPETIGFVLLQECIWFNQCVCKVRQQLHSLRSRLFTTADYKLPPQLLETAQALSAEEVPPSWQHPSESPNTHVLLTWLDEMVKRFSQFRSWIKCGNVPLDGKTPVGNLASVWLGGMVNPGALLIALCQEKAVLHDATLDQIRIMCALSCDDDSTEHEAGITLEGVSLLNAKWDTRNECVTMPTDDITVSPLPPLCFYPTLVTSQEEEENVKKQTKENLVTFPVYMNLSRETPVCYLPLPSDNISRFSEHEGGLPYASHCYVILQSGPGLTQRDAFKSRAYLANKRREQWSRVAPEVSDLMSRSGTRMSSAKNSLSGPRMSIASLPPSITGGKVPSKPIDPRLDGPSPEDGSVMSQKSMSNKSLSSHDSLHARPSNVEPPQAPQPSLIPNGHVKQSRDDEVVPPDVEPNLEPDQQELEREGSILQAILDDEQPSEDDRSQVG